MNFVSYKKTVQMICSLCLLLLIASCSYGPASQATVLYPEEKKEVNELWPDKELKSLFAHYWFLRFDGRVKDSFAMEAPYFKAIVNENHYKLYTKGAKKNELIDLTVLDIIKETNRLYEIHYQIRFKNAEGEEMLRFRKDNWLKMHDHWYHVLRDKMIFPM